MIPIERTSATMVTYRTPFPVKISSPLRPEDLRPTKIKKETLKLENKARSFMRRVIKQRELQQEKNIADQFDAEDYWLKRIEPILIRKSNDIYDSQQLVIITCSVLDGNNLIKDKLGEYSPRLKAGAS